MWLLVIHLVGGIIACASVEQFRDFIEINHNPTEVQEKMRSFVGGESGKVTLYKKPETSHQDDICQKSPEEKAFACWQALNKGNFHMEPLFYDAVVKDPMDCHVTEFYYSVDTSKGGAFLPMFKCPPELGVHDYSMLSMTPDSEKGFYVSPADENTSLFLFSFIRKRQGIYLEAYVTGYDGSLLSKEFGIRKTIRSVLLRPATIQRKEDVSHAIARGKTYNEGLLLIRSDEGVSIFY